MTTAWTLADVARIGRPPRPAAPRVTAAEAAPLLPGIDLWDMWPAQDVHGATLAIAGGELWFVLSAPALPDPVDRHGMARIRMLHRTAAGWTDLGPALPDGFSPGSREWSGSAIAEGPRLTLYFTAAGRRGETGISFEQRLFACTGRLDVVAGLPRIAGWTPPTEILASDGVIYDLARESSGAVGTIKAFRDPVFFRDPADGRDWLLFTGSLAASASAFNGCIGLAGRDGPQADWQLQAPLLHADGLNNELERPHIVVHGGRYHLFWSTQDSVFAPGIAAPTGLYGMVADSMAGTWRPINGSGLVIANPPDAPAQAYSWLVLDDLRVASFVDIREPSLGGRKGFGGVPAPVLQLRIEGSSAALV